MSGEALLEGERVNALKPMDDQSMLIVIKSGKRSPPGEALW
jgi:hypothetical protein